MRKGEVGGVGRIPARYAEVFVQVVLVDDGCPMDEQIGKSETAALEGLKVVVSIREGRAIIGVQRSSADPHIGSFNDSDASGLAQELSAVLERAKARWEDSPKYPAYSRPTTSAGRRARRRIQLLRKRILSNRR